MDFGFGEFDLGSILSSLGPLMQFGGGLYNMFGGGGSPAPQPQYQPGPPQQIQFPDFGGMFQDFFQSQQDMFQAQQDQFQQQQAAAQLQQQQQQQKALQSRLAGLKTDLQGKGIYSGGALTPESLAALIGDPNTDPKAVYDALTQMGAKDTWNPGTGINFTG